MDNRAWTIITDNPIVLDFTECKYYATLHELIKKAFGFPEYYGKNLDALWDCMRDFAYSQHGQREVQICGVSQMPTELQGYFQEVMDVFYDIQHACPNVNFTINS